MITDTWETEGPRKIRAQFTHSSPVVVMKLAYGEHVIILTFDEQEFKSFLKAGLRFDEKVTSAQD